MERIINEENNLDHNVGGDAVEGLVVCVSIHEVLQTLNEVKTGKAPGPSEVSLELIAVGWAVGIQMMAEIFQRVLNGFGMPVEWALSIVFPILFVLNTVTKILYSGTQASCSGIICGVCDFLLL